MMIPQIAICFHAEADGEQRKHQSKQQAHAAEPCKHSHHKRHKAERARRQQSTKGAGSSSSHDEDVAAAVPPQIPMSDDDMPGVSAAVRLLLACWYCRSTVSKIGLAQPCNLLGLLSNALCSIWQTLQNTDIV